MSTYNFDNLLDAWEKYQEAKVVRKEAEEHRWDCEGMVRIISESIRDEQVAKDVLESVFKDYLTIEMRGEFEMRNL